MFSFRVWTLEIDLDYLYISIKAKLWNWRQNFVKFNFETYDEERKCEFLDFP